MENIMEDTMEKLTAEGARNTRSWMRPGEMRPGEMRPDQMKPDQMKPGRIRNEDME